jgi:hypothetical protein
MFCCIFYCVVSLCSLDSLKRRHSRKKIKRKERLGNKKGGRKRKNKNLVPVVMGNEDISFLEGRETWERSFFS